MLVSAACLSGCGKQQPESGYVARVGNATLSEKDLAAVRGTQAEHLVRQYVTNWVTSEMLFQEAQDRGFAASEEVRRQIDEARKQFAINAFLEDEIYGDDAAGDSELEEEFTTNRDAYRLRDDLAKLSFAIFDERDAANAFRLKILRGTTWRDAVQAVRSDPEQNAHLLRVATGEYFTQAIAYPEELWKLARTLGKEDISYVVRSGSGYFVALVHATWRQGDIPEFEYAKTEVRQRLALRHRNEKYQELLQHLRSKYHVDVRIPRIETGMDSLVAE